MTPRAFTTIWAVTLLATIGAGELYRHFDHPKSATSLPDGGPRTEVAIPTAGSCLSDKESLEYVPCAPVAKESRCQLETKMGTIDVPCSMPPEVREKIIEASNHRSQSKDRY